MLVTRLHSHFLMQNIRGKSSIRNLFILVTLPLLFICPFFLRVSNWTRALVSFYHFLQNSHQMVLWWWFKERPYRDTCFWGGVGLSDTLLLPKHRHPPLFISPFPPPESQFTVWKRLLSFVTHQLNHILPQFIAAHALLVHFVVLLNYTNKVIFKVIIPYCSLPSPLSQTLLGLLAQSRSHGCLVGEEGKEGQHRQECLGRK